MSRCMTHKFCALLYAAVVCCTVATADQFPPLCVEISPDHPLFAFAVSTHGAPDPAAKAQRIIEIWDALPEGLRAYSVLRIDLDSDDPAIRHEHARMLLTSLQEVGVPLVIQLAGVESRYVYPLGPAEELLRNFTCVKGVAAKGLVFDEYAAGGGIEDLVLPANVQWLAGVIDLGARYGRFVAIELDGLQWPRVMSNARCRPLYDRIHACRPYVIPTVSFRRGPVVPALSSVLGLWLEGAANQWGIGATSEWYADAGFVEPGVFGPPREAAQMPARLYRAMILNGVMTGASVYMFTPGADLWFGDNRSCWDETIAPTLDAVLRMGLIPRKDFVADKVKVVYQLARSDTPRDFHLNMRDIDPVLDAGLLVHGAYGVEPYGADYELILNSGRHYWTPVLSPYASEEALRSFAGVVQPGTMNSAAQWTELLDRHYQPDGLGTAFISRIGRGIFVMNSRENLFEEQSFRIHEVPAPVRGIQAERQADGILVTWPFREGDVAYKVWRRLAPEQPYALAVEDLEQRRWLDTGVAPTETVTYTVTALTSAQEVYEGTVNFCDYLALSTVESRIAEEVTVSPTEHLGKSLPIETAPDPRPKTQTWWPTFEGVTDTHLPAAQAIALRIETWGRAFAQEDLNGVLDLYSTAYEDPQAWGFQYVRRAYQWFFERHMACRMQRQVRRWDFSSSDTTGDVRVLLFCRFSGVAVSDAAGRQADVAAHFPRTDTGEVWLTLAKEDDTWRVKRTEPALPNFKDILSFSSGPYDGFTLGPDVYTQ